MKGTVFIKFTFKYRHSTSARLSVLMHEKRGFLYAAQIKHPIDNWKSVKLQINRMTK